MEQEAVEVNYQKELQEALTACMKCHLCNTVCPVCETRVTQGPYGISRSIYYSFEWDHCDEHLRDLVYSCTTCGKCVAKCEHVSRALPLVEAVEKMREYLLVEKMKGPMPGQTNVLKNMYVRGNPWGNAPQERTLWAKELKIPYATEENPVDVLYYVGCASSYDSQAQKIAKSLAKIMQHAGLRFGILEGETCSGSEAKRMGETGLFQYLMEQNLENFKKAGVRHVVTGDPHSFYSFTHEYEKSEITFEHYTQFLNDLIDEGRLTLTREVSKKVTYHDPCYLGRHCGVFEEPRKLIRRIPGLEFVEIEDSGENSNCCGMGGGRMWTELPEGFVTSQKIGEARIVQALATGAEVLLTACPFCNITLNDAVKDLGKESALKVTDITECLCEAL